MFQLQLFFLLHCDEWDRVVALPRHKFVTGATLLQLILIQSKKCIALYITRGSVSLTFHSALRKLNNCLWQPCLGMDHNKMCTLQRGPSIDALVTNNLYYVTLILISNEVYSIQHYVIKFISDLRQGCGFLRLLRFPSPIKLTVTI